MLFAWRTWVRRERATVAIDLAGKVRSTGTTGKTHGTETGTARLGSHLTPDATRARAPARAQHT